MHDPIRLGVLISGGGTTLQNFLDRIAAGELDAEVAVVLASSAKAYGLQRARAAGVPAHVVRRRDFDSVEAFSDANFRILDAAKVDLVTLAGYLKLLRIPEAYLGRVMNIHPALIPAFCGDQMYGHRVHDAVIAAGVKVSGCTVHFADNVYDHGPIIVQRTAPVYDTDTPEDLQARVFEQECMAYPAAIRLFAAGRLQIDGQITRILPP
jgi:formyltetrahydrofolate-dependent phosphoribosylglycinamide formyltransferase